MKLELPIVWSDRHRLHEPGGEVWIGVRTPGPEGAPRGASAAALTAADLVSEGTARAAYALTRPPGHHVTRTAHGGSCYLNSTAAAAARLARTTDAPVAVIDVDAHHGNGTQSIFY